MVNMYDEMTIGNVKHFCLINQVLINQLHIMTHLNFLYNLDHTSQNLLH